eukprot:TRINITY_DN11318_c0_g3_i1.p4 TRINITY_DN11318_c0_g3~~TRINITY_DN11318_c0_g3_i1.p4  ORF type:complete len:104 (+),score=2.26 TRINITY_DN11318_c0_g3_i1:256-567(+)
MIDNMLLFILFCIGKLDCLIFMSFFKPLLVNLCGNLLYFGFMVNFYIQGIFQQIVDENKVVKMKNMIIFYLFILQMQLGFFILQGFFIVRLESWFVKLIQTCV